MTNLLQDHPESTDRHDDDGTRFGLAFVVFCWLIIAIVAYVRYQGPTPKSADVPDDQFSCVRAEVILERLVGDGIPHSSGTEQNKIVRQRVIDCFTESGYEVETQAGTGLRWYDSMEVPLVNVLARLPADPNSPTRNDAIVLLAHYDSALNAAGAADDGVGTAVVLEVARMLKLQNAPQHEIIFLITDGEEFGLLGAKMFVNANAHKNVVAVINLEARGTSGPSAMFETNVGNEFVIPMYARTAVRPLCSSLFYEIYQRMPNDTDFTVFKEAGLPGCNFAFIGDVENYHTLNDRIPNVDRRSIQHHGDNMWALIREFDQHELFMANDGAALTNVVYFDFFAWTVFWWPEYVNYILIVVIAVGGVMILRKKFTTESEFVKTNKVLEKIPVQKKFVRLLANRGFGSWNFCMGVAVVAILGCASAHYALEFAADDARGPWVKDAVFVEMSFWCFALCVITAMVWLFEKQQLRWHCQMVLFLVWLAAAIAAAIGLAGAAYLFIVPLLFFCVAGTALMALKTRWFYVILPICIGAIWLPLERVFYDAIGFQYDNKPLIFRVVLISLSAMPLVLATRKKWVPIYSMGFAAIGFVCALISVLW